MVLLPDLPQRTGSLGHGRLPLLGLLLVCLSPSQRGLGSLLPIR
ncbi:hypothetical protein ACFVS9_28130 [Streptomyces sp. NPDC058008]